MTYQNAAAIAEQIGEYRPRIRDRAEDIDYKLESIVEEIKGKKLKLAGIDQWFYISNCTLIRKADGTWIDGHGPQANRLSDEDIATIANSHEPFISRKKCDYEQGVYDGMRHYRDNHTGPQAAGQPEQTSEGK